MTSLISASPEQLVTQASMTAAEYLIKAVREIDDQFGDGYAKEHPDLIVGFMQTAAADFGAAVLAQHIRAGLDNVAEAIRSTSE